MNKYGVIGFGLLALATGVGAKVVAQHEAREAYIKGCVAGVLGFGQYLGVEFSPTAPQDLAETCGHLYDGTEEENRD